MYLSDKSLFSSNRIGGFFLEAIVSDVHFRKNQGYEQEARLLFGVVFGVVQLGLQIQLGFAADACIAAQAPDEVMTSY